MGIFAIVAIGNNRKIVLGVQGLALTRHKKREAVSLV